MCAAVSIAFFPEGCHAFGNVSSLPRHNSKYTGRDTWVFIQLFVLKELDSNRVVSRFHGCPQGCLTGHRAAHSSYGMLAGCLRQQGFESSVPSQRTQGNLRLLLLFVPHRTSNTDISCAGCILSMQCK